MACGFWQNAEQIDSILLVRQAATVLTEPCGSAPVVETSLTTSAVSRQTFSVQGRWSRLS